MKIKVFTTTHQNEMEPAVNAWLDQNPTVEIQHVRQSESMNDESWSLTLTILYSDKEHTAVGFQSVRTD